MPHGSCAPIPMPSFTLGLVYLAHDHLLALRGCVSDQAECQHACPRQGERKFPVPRGANPAALARGERAVLSGPLFSRAEPPASKAARCGLCLLKPDSSPRPGSSARFSETPSLSRSIPRELGSWPGAGPPALICLDLWEQGPGVAHAPRPTRLRTRSGPRASGRFAASVAGGRCQCDRCLPGLTALPAALSRPQQ